MTPPSQKQKSPWCAFYRTLPHSVFWLLTYLYLPRHVVAITVLYDKPLKTQRFKNSRFYLARESMDWWFRLDTSSELCWAHSRIWEWISCQLVSWLCSICVSYPSRRLILMYTHNWRQRCKNRNKRAKIVLQASGDSHLLKCHWSQQDI